jgi:hypothetical protein
VEYRPMIRSYAANHGIARSCEKGVATSSCQAMTNSSGKQAKPKRPTSSLPVSLPLSTTTSLIVPIDSYPLAMSSSSMASLIPNSAITSSSQHPLLQQQLNVFALPSQILDGLTVRSVNVPTTNTSSAQRENANIDENLSKMDDEELGAAEGGGGGGSGLSCGICPGAKFEDVSEQRAHYKEDWHRYNVRVKMTAAGVGGGEKKDSKGKGRVLGREEFEGMVEGESCLLIRAILVASETGSTVRSCRADVCFLAARSSPPFFPSILSHRPLLHFRLRIDDLFSINRR